MAVIVSLAGFTFGIPEASLAQDTNAIPALLIAPAFLRPPVYRYLPGSRKTILYPALIKSDGEVEALDEKTFSKPEDWDHFIKDSQERSKLQLATLDPSLVRDSHGVIQMAVIFTDSPVTATCVLTPGFLEHFSAIFGPELLIAIPSQNKIYVFPKLASRLDQMTETIRDDYLISAKPASTEIFELSKAGLRAVAPLNSDDE